MLNNHTSKKQYDYLTIISYWIFQNLFKRHKTIYRSIMIAFYRSPIIRLNKKAMIAQRLPKNNSLTV